MSIRSRIKISVKIKGNNTWIYGIFQKYIRTNIYRCEQKTDKVREITNKTRK